MAKPANIVVLPLSATVDNSKADSVFTIGRMLIILSTYLLAIHSKSAHRGELSIKTHTITIHVYMHICKGRRAHNI